MLVDIIMPRYFEASINNPVVKTSYNTDLNAESKILINKIKSNMETKAEEELELLQAGSLKKRVGKFDDKVKKNLGVTKEKK